MHIVGQLHTSDYPIGTYHGSLEERVRVRSFGQDFVDVQEGILCGLAALRQVVYLRLVRWYRAERGW